MKAFEIEGAESIVKKEEILSFVVAVFLCTDDHPEGRQTGSAVIIKKRYLICSKHQLQSYEAFLDQASVESNAPPWLSIRQNGQEIGRSHSKSVLYKANDLALIKTDSPLKHEPASLVLGVTPAIMEGLQNGRCAAIGFPAEYEGARQKIFPLEKIKPHEGQNAHGRSDELWVRPGVKSGCSGGAVVVKLNEQWHVLGILKTGSRASGTASIISTLVTSDAAKVFLQNNQVDAEYRYWEDVDELLNRWRAYQHNKHGKLVQWFTSDPQTRPEELYVEIELEWRYSPERDRSSGLRAREELPEKNDREAPRTFESLQKLLEYQEQGRPGRFAVLGEPGAGKTTLARHLVHRLTEARPGVALPLYIPLARLAESRTNDPFQWLDMNSFGFPGLGGRLQQMKETPGRLWLLLDGFDELAPANVRWVMEQLDCWASELREVVIAVFSRPVGFEELGSSFRKARLKPLSDAAQKELLVKWLGDENGDRIYEHLRQDTRIRENVRNPLMLSLMAAWCKERLDKQEECAEGARLVPPKMLVLYQHAIEILLRRGHSTGALRRGASEEKGGVKEPKSAEEILRALSLRLQQVGRENWPIKELEIRLDESLGGPSKQALRSKLDRWWNGHETFLVDIGERSGILAPHDGPEEPWKYLHRTFKEVLAAEALTENGSGAVTTLAKELKPDELGRWGETLALCAGRMDKPLDLIERLAEHSVDAALRALMNAEGIPPEHVLGFLFTLDEDNWDGDYLARLLKSWFIPPDIVKNELTNAATRKRTKTQLAYLYYAIEQFAGVLTEQEREGFFRKSGCWPKRGRPEEVSKVMFVEIPGGAFFMGSPESEDGRYGDEGPRHEVTVRGFRLAKTPITKEQYAAFDPSHKSDGNRECPVTVVSWWQAYLFTKWLGGRLPSEAEWEYACRAGTRTRYYTGDSESDLDRAGWYDGNSGRRLHSVGEKEPNKFGLYDMHGNVYEWCEDDWHDDYADAPVDGSAWLEDPRAGGRVYRGGSWDLGAGNCRSAYRFFWFPGYRYYRLGFRPARSNP
ncbi:MAG: SUMF1/EgtB/PvdO family nonheme iron enzyme [Deltaproteobacteria bacterium]|nr:SUMF1/EgtB/PvdO family nonheme iron enzyme [Deltaproteobacteria bacterium]